MSHKKVQELYPDDFLSTRPDEIDNKPRRLAYQQTAGYDENGELIFSSVKRPRYKNGGGFVISYTSKMSEFIASVSTGSIVRTFLFIAHHQSYGNDGIFGYRCSHKHLQMVLGLQKSTLWDALKYLKEHHLIVENKVDGATEFMVNPSYVTIGADRNLRERMWIMRNTTKNIDNPPSAVKPPKRQSSASSCFVVKDDICDMN